jgi:predicted MFS family arabinose efflux permease
MNSRLITWMIWITASVFYAYQYVLRVLPNIILTDIMQHFEIDAATFGQFSGVYYIGYSLMHVPVGIMLDRFGPRKIMSGCILLTVLGLSPLVFTKHWIFPIVGRLLIGLGSSAAILGLFKIIRLAFKEQHFARMLSFSVMIGLIGAIYGGGPVNYMRESFGYETVVYLFGALGILLAGATYWIVPKHTATPTSSTILSDLKEILGQGRVIWTCLFAGFMVGPLEGFADVWGTAFLKQVVGLDGVAAASLPSLIFVGMCFGAPALSFIAEKTGNYLSTIVGAGLTMVACFLLLLTSATPGSIAPNFALVGVCSAYQILAIYKSSTYVRESVAGITTAVANMIIMIFGYVFHTLIGSIINAMGGPTSREALLYGVGVIPIGLSLGSIGFILLFIQERKQALAKSR